MATHTFGTSATNSLTAVTYNMARATLSDADLATICNAIFDDGGIYPLVPGAFVRNGLLVVPRRGVLKILPGDIVAVDTTASVGWPILVSANAKANGAWTYV